MEGIDFIYHICHNQKMMVQIVCTSRSIPSIAIGKELTFRLFEICLAVFKLKLSDFNFLFPFMDQFKVSINNSLIT